MDFLHLHWNWIASDPLGAIGLVLLCISLGWGAASLFYRERMEILKEKNGARESQASSTAFSYPTHGRHGKNILANSTSDITTTERLSLRAEIPTASKLHIEMRGPKPEYLDDTSGSWTFTVGQTINWTASDYDFQAGGKQSFDAEGGIADMQLNFRRTGEVHITAYEGTAQEPSWVKTLHVHSVA